MSKWTVRMGRSPQTYSCPFCAGEFVLPDADDLERGEADAALVHSMPPCRTFVALEPDEFVRQAGAKEAAN